MRKFTATIEYVNPASEDRKPELASISVTAGSVETARLKAQRHFHHAFDRGKVSMQIQSIQIRGAY